MVEPVEVIVAVEAVKKSNPDTIVIETSLGEIVLQLAPKSAPETVANFKSYIDESFFDGLIFHRVMKNFMIQGGGFKVDLNRQNAKRTVINESIGGLSNIHGSIAMARTNNPDSASSQFFINHKDNLFLDGQPNKAGYTVFGQVIKGLDIVDLIANVKTTRKNGMGDVPVDDVVISTIRYASDSEIEEFNKTSMPLKTSDK
ncbi:MAG: peptidylprolyl isomerase [Saccharospirillaceae bacterium]|nr:peptidylprolyl isomerase [Saccharospirillaceae bacterium]